MSTPSLPPVVDAAFVHEARGEAVLADVRWYADGRDGRAAYEAGHLPGARFVDLEVWLAGDPGVGRGRHPLPDPETFARGMATTGIGDGDRVVAYDDVGGVIAARLVWMLRAVGADAALLDGGMAALPGALETGDPAAVPAASFTARPWPAERLADIDDATERTHVVLDARPADRYAGAPDALDPRAGHIPGARSLPCREHLGPDGRLLPVAALRERFAAVGVTGEESVVSSCGSGVTACHNLLVQEHAGLGTGRLFPGSWSQYSRESGRPVATGESPG
jgi:thiosulfate/3-mercaptopyruvate sulfurtransferase